MRLEDAALERMPLAACGLGFTATREYLRPLLRHIETGRLNLRALRCSLTLPGTRSVSTPEQRATDFHLESGLTGVIGTARAGKGRPPNSDFTPWLAGEHKEEYAGVRVRHASRSAGDICDPQALRDELTRINGSSMRAVSSRRCPPRSLAVVRTLARHRGPLDDVDLGQQAPVQLCQTKSPAETARAATRGLRTCHLRASAFLPRAAGKPVRHQHNKG